MANNFFSLLLIGGILYLCFGAMLFFNQSRMVYFPENEIITTPGEIGLAYEDVRFRAEDAILLAGWFIKNEQDKGTILFCHGNAGNISHRLASIEIFHRLGYSIFIFDYRGYGESQGKPTEKGTYLDAEAAWKYLTQEKHLMPSDIIIFGRSLGGAVGAWLADKKNPAACILESVFTSAKDMASAIYPFMPASLICRFDYNTLKAVKKINAPLLIIHSPDDEIVPFSHGRRLFDAAREPKAFLKLSGDHNSGFMISGMHYKNGLRDFLESLQTTSSPLTQQPSSKYIH
jgi:uncharacterized protein